jgi:hypothetical protein
MVRCRSSTALTAHPEPDRGAAGALHAVGRSDQVQACRHRRYRLEFQRSGPLRTLVFPGLHSLWRPQRESVQRARSENAAANGMIRWDSYRPKGDGVPRRRRRSVRRENGRLVRRVSRKFWGVLLPPEFAGGRHGARAGVRCALVGGLAVSARTEPRFTRDADLAVAVASDAEAESLIRALYAEERLALDPLSGHLFLFSNRSVDRLRIP